MKARSPGTVVTKLEGMRAAVLDAYGPAHHLVVKDLPEPTVVHPTDVVVGVRAAAINPIDVKIRAGSQRGVLRYRLPWVLGLDVAGHVLAVGSAVTRFAEGDAVLGCPDWRRPGAYAERCVVDERHLVAKPPSWSFTEAAGLPLAGLTAWQCLRPPSLNPGARVLIQAGSGGVGHLAIQIAKHHGAWVATTCSARNHGFVEGLGADQAIDYRAEPWWKQVADLDLVLDAVGGPDRWRAQRVVRRGGRVASIVSGMPANQLRFGPTLGVAATGVGLAAFWLAGRLRGIDAVTVIKRTDAEQLTALTHLVEQGALRVQVDRTFPLEAVAEAHAYAELGRVRGKVVLTV